MIRRLFLPLAYVLCVLFVFAGCASARGAYDLKTLGVEYQAKELKEPRPNRVHVLRVDFSKGKTEAAAVVADDPDGNDPAEAALTSPLKLVENQPPLAFVNANPWDSLPDTSGKKNRSWYEGQPVDVLGLAASGGRMRSAADGRVAVWVDAGGRVSVGTPPTDGSVVEGVGGFTQIVKEGVVVAVPEGPVHPRTAIGVDKGGSTMFLVAVDGRQKGYSEGMTVEQLACVMRDLGCWDAANMDGGGSSIMGLIGRDGRLRIMNSPSDRSQINPLTPRIRPVPVILTIRRKNQSASDRLPTLSGSHRSYSSHVSHSLSTKE